MAWLGAPWGCQDEGLPPRPHGWQPLGGGESLRSAVTHPSHQLGCSGAASLSQTCVCVRACPATSLSQPAACAHSLALRPMETN